MKLCPGCKITRPLDAFNKSSGRKDGLQVYCRDCTKSHAKSHYERNKPYYRDKVQRIRQRNSEFVRGLRNLPCTDCKVEYPWYVMDFDHLDPATKVLELARASNNGWSLEKLQEEMEKCELVCANCHRIRTYNRRENIIPE